MKRSRRLSESCWDVPLPELFRIDCCDSLPVMRLAVDPCRVHLWRHSAPEFGPSEHLVRVRCTA